MRWGICISWSPDSTRLAFTTSGVRASDDVLVVEIAGGSGPEPTEEKPAAPGDKPLRLKVDGTELPSFASESRSAPLDERRRRSALRRRG